MRCAASVPVGIFTMVSRSRNNATVHDLIGGKIQEMMYFWIVTHYPVVELHLMCCITFALTYVGSNAFNTAIGFPSIMFVTEEQEMVAIKKEDVLGL